MVKKRLSEFHVGDFDDSNLPHIGGLQRRGMLLVLSAPSGGGKTTMANELIATDPDVFRSTSCTTRKPRGQEIDGKEYHFVTHDRFHEMKGGKELLEWTQVYENFYGTPLKQVDDALAQGKDVLFAIDNHGARQIKEVAPEDIVSVFILPPSMEELERRLINRGQDTPESVRIRMKDLEKEIEYYRDYDYVIINRNLEDSMLKLRTILGAERMKRDRLHGLEDFSQRLQSELSERRNSIEN